MEPLALAGLSQVLPRGAAEPAAEGGHRPRGCDAGLHQRLAGRPALPERQGEEETRSRRHPVRYAAIGPNQDKENKKRTNRHPNRHAFFDLASRCRLVMNEPGVTCSVLCPGESSEEQRVG